jgi:DUF1680 family protein
VTTSSLFSQAIQSHSARHYPGEQVLNVSAALPAAKLSPVAPGEVTLLPGLFRERRELAKAYVARLKTENVLQNHLLEAGVRIDRPYEQMHQGWESPHCQLRGHFAGHWLSALAQFAAIDRDPMLAARVREAVAELKRCQELNHGEWVGSVPEKYFTLLAEGRPIWSPQYTVHKTLMGLLDAHRYAHDDEALSVLRHSADWFATWSENLIASGKGASIYSGECAGMLELWADLYSLTKDEHHLRLAARYAMPDLFRALLDGGDPLSNDHANASIPWIHGAARLYEVTGDPRYRAIVEAFWQQAVTTRGMFATTGNNAGEFWVPPGQFGRFIGNRTQEHCTVYNMIRVAQYLLRWTGEARYADYIERALYNGVLAQQNPATGMVCYFLPLNPGAKKVWGSETRDFWCCHGTAVQAQAMFEDLIYYRTADGVSMAQFIPSKASFGADGERIRLALRNDDRTTIENFSSDGEITRAAFTLQVTAERATRWTLRIRQPAWASAPGTVTIDGAPVAATVSPAGFLEIDREWKNASVTVSFPKRITREPLPGDPERFALLDGPVVLAALDSAEPALTATSAVTPRYEHQYVEGRDWQTGHFAVRTPRGTVELKPLYEIADESYCVYFHAAR